MSAPSSSIVSQRPDLPPITHDILLRAGRGEATPRVPVWAMRQAGRYLPEFLEVRKRADFFTMCQTPALSCEVTLQPLRRFAGLLDAVVIFSDILIVPQAMGLLVEMEAGKGPVLPAPLDSPADLARLTLVPDVRARLAYLFEAITLTRRTAAAEVAAVPVIGFAGGPWTLMSYMIEGGGSKTYEKSKAWLVRHAEASHTLLAAITGVVVELLLGQWEAGASVLQVRGMAWGRGGGGGVHTRASLSQTLAAPHISPLPTPQVFESHAGELSPAAWGTFALPYLRDIARRVRARVPPVEQGGPLLILFPRCAHHALAQLSADDAGAGGCGYDAISLDWGFDPASAVATVAERCGRGKGER